MATHPSCVQILSYRTVSMTVKSAITGHESAYSTAHHCLPHLFLFHADMMSMGKKMVHELLGAFPGIDEAMSFAEVMRYCLYVIDKRGSAI